MQANIESLQPLFVSAEFDQAAAKIFGERVYRVEVAVDLVGSLFGKSTLIR